MDGKPLRPLKSLRGGGDENAIQPELHKYKSTSALSAKVAVGGGNGIRAAAKRTAMGDLSNTLKQYGTVQDDSAINTKGYELKKQPTTTNTAALSRPPVRSIINTSIPTAKPIPTSKVVPVPTKRTNPVFKDSELEHPANNGSIELHVPKHGSALNDAILDYEMPAINGQAVSLQEFVDFVRGRSDDPASKATLMAQVEKSELTSAEMHKIHVGLSIEKEQVEAGHGGATLDHEEAWDMDEDDDDQEYTTAHSFRSKGDNTTGCAAPILCPVETTKSREELKAAASFVGCMMTTEEFDDEQWDTTMVAEYAEEIFQYMREQEVEFLPAPDYMEIQGEIQWPMRAVLMDWMIQVHQRCGLTAETLYLTVNCIDRFLSVKVVSLGKLQLVGATALFIAAKYEEINCPTINEIVFMVDNGYTADEILKAERYMLMMLGFKLGAPGPLSFLRRVSKADEYDLLTRTYAKYFMELTIMDERFVACPASAIAAGAHLTARLVQKINDWTPHHVHYSGYTFEQLRPIVSLMLHCCQNAEQHHAAVYAKYAEKRFQKVSTLVREAMTTGLGVIVPGQKVSYHAYGMSAPLAPSSFPAAYTYSYR